MLCPELFSHQPQPGIVLAVSGGTDSMALLDIFYQLAKTNHWNLVVAHLNHCLRGSESDGDENYVIEQCQTLSVRCITRRIDINMAAQVRGQSIETAARELRYDFLREVCQMENCRYIATGHHADDNVETILQRIIRGTGIKGLAGINPTRTVKNDFGNLVIFRPLLQITRSELESYIRETNITPCHDSSNDSCDYNRNRIRNNLIPLLQSEYNQKLSAAIGNLGLLAADADEILTQQAESDIADGNILFGNELLRISLAFINRLSASRARNMLRYCIVNAGLPLGSIGLDVIEHLRQECSDTSSRLLADLPGNWLTEISDSQLIIARKLADESIKTVSLTIPGLTKLENYVNIKDFSPVPAIKAEFTDMTTFDLKAYLRSKPENQEIIDLDKLAGSPCVRPLIASEKYSPLGLNGSQTTGNLMTNHKVPRHQRNRIATIYDELGIIAIAGHRIADRVKVSSSTCRAIILTFMATV